MAVDTKSLSNPPKRPKPRKVSLYMEKDVYERIERIAKRAAGKPSTEIRRLIVESPRYLAEEAS